MYHSVTFGDKNTWKDWHLVPASRPTFSMPPLKERYVDLPGVNGSIDMTEAVTGYPVYGNRTGSMEFIVMNEWYAEDGSYVRGTWHERYSDIANYLHGRRMHAVLEDDPQFYYDGRFKLQEWRSEKDYSRIVIEYSVDPYKWYYTTTADTQWKWDPFNFETDMILATVYTGILITDGRPKEISFSEYFDRYIDPSVLYGYAPVKVFATTNAPYGALIQYPNFWTGALSTMTIEKDVPTLLPELIFINRTTTIKARTVADNGTLSLDFRPGRL